MIRFIVRILTLLTLVAGAAYYLLQENVSFYVTFTDAKRLAAGDTVYLTGQPVGKVVKIVPDKGKIGVAVHVDRKYRDLITSASAFYIDRDRVVPNHMSLLVRTPASDGGRPLKAKDTLDGVDSSLVWSSLEVADQVHEIVRSGPWQDLMREVDRVAQDFKKAVKQIDLDRLGADLRSDIDTLSKDIDSALQGKDTQSGLYELQNQIEHVRQRIKRLGDSEESRQLQEALSNFQKKLMEKIRREEDKTATQRTESSLWFAPQVIA